MQQNIYWEGRHTQYRSTNSAFTAAGVQLPKLIFQEQSQYYYTWSNPREHCTGRPVKAVSIFFLVHMGQPTQTCSLATTNTDMGALITIITHYPRTSEFKIVSVSCWGHPTCNILDARASLLSAAGALHSAHMGACCSLWMLWNACCRAEVFSCPQSPEPWLQHALQLLREKVILHVVDQR